MIYAFAIGFFAGLRSLTPPAVTAWAARLGWLDLYRPLSLVGSVPSVAILTVLGLAELVGDKLPQTPNRTAALGLIARLLSGSFCGACLASSAGEPTFVGALLGATGGIAGAFGGYAARKRLVRGLNAPDISVALIEDLLAVAGSIWIVSR
jgi:uncharacterized membrane protein